MMEKLLLLILGINTAQLAKPNQKFFVSAQNDFKDVIFLFYEQTEHPEIAKYLKIDYWTTIAIYRYNKEIAREMGLTDKNKIYELIKKGI